MAWESLIATLLGGALAIAGGWLAAWLPIRERRSVRRLELAEQRRAFERENLDALGRLLPLMMRDAALIHSADVKAAKQTGVYAGHLLPEGLTPGELERGQEFAHRTELILDDALRAAFQSLRDRLSSQGLGPRDLASGEQGFLALMAEYESLSKALGVARRRLWIDDADAKQL